MERYRKVEAERLNREQFFHGLCMVPNVILYGALLASLIALINGFAAEVDECPITWASHADVLECIEQSQVLTMERQ